MRVDAAWMVMIVHRTQWNIDHANQITGAVWTLCLETYS